MKTTQELKELLYKTNKSLTSSLMPLQKPMLSAKVTRLS